jgi:hypothetical protein
VYHPAQRDYSATGRAGMHRQFLGYGLWHYDLVELLKQWYVAEKIEENQRARVEDGRFSRATRSFQGRTGFYGFRAWRSSSARSFSERSG